MSREITDFSILIDEQFDCTETSLGRVTEFILRLF